MIKTIDLHCHILPGVDDGSPDLTTSLELAKVAVNQGINEMLLTPHHMDGEYINNKFDVLQQTANFQDELDKHAIPLKVRAGQEIHINGNLLKEIEHNNVLFADEHRHYLMLELPHNEVPEYTNDMIFELQVHGIKPVIVHPERNRGFQSDPDKLYDLVRMGCLTQITASSYVGSFGKHVQKFTKQIMNANLGFTFASDAHNLIGRNFQMQQAYSFLADRNQRMYEEYLDNAEKIWNGENLNDSEIKHIDNTNYILKLFNFRRFI